MPHQCKALGARRRAQPHCRTRTQWSSCRHQVSARCSCWMQTMTTTTHFGIATSTMCSGQQRRWVSPHDRWRSSCCWQARPSWHRSRRRWNMRTGATPCSMSSPLLRRTTLGGSLTHHQGCVQSASSGSTRRSVMKLGLSPSSKPGSSQRVRATPRDRF